ncbi:MAG TPA: hypothetical protein VNT25_05325 [Allosphingosinicella sp.]|nr:hypothetical protein [Allosphingosinicella sp.]
MGHSVDMEAFLMERRLLEAASGNADALYELGLAYSSGIDGAEPNLVEAHKWFNLAALNGSRLAQESRAEVADYMTAREIAEAQRQARAWLTSGMQRAA